MKNASGKKVAEKIKARFLFSITSPPPNNRTVGELIGKIW